MTELVNREQSSVTVSAGSSRLGRPASVFGVLFLLLPLFIVFAPKGLVVWIGLTILALPRMETWPSLATWRFSPIAGVVLLLFLWALITLYWSPVPGVEKLLWLAVVCFVGGLSLISLGALDWPARDHVRTRLIICLVVITVLLTFETLTGLRFGMWLLGDFDFNARLSHIGRSGAAVAVMAWVPLVLIARRKTWTAGLRGPIIASVVLLFLLVDVVILQAFASALALTLAPLAFLLVYWRRRVGLSILGALIIGYLFLAPTIHIWPLEQQEEGVRTSLPFSWQYRIETWRSTAEKIFENPIFGHGFDSVRELGQANVTMAGVVAQEIPLHPHNAFLQVWFELGLIGVLLLAALICLILIGIGSARASPARSGVYAAVLASYLVIALISFSAWQTWWIACAWLAAGILSLLGGRPRVTSSAPAYS